MRRTRVICLVLIAYFASCASDCTEENDLWLLMSSYEDIGITVKDLAFFLATHGYSAEPDKTYVTVKLSGGKEVYLTPNGASPRLADLWMSPPTKPSGPILTIPLEAIKKNISYKKTGSPDFVKTASRYVIFPVTPLGMCYDGSKTLDNTYKSFGYNVTFMYDPGGFNNQGHLWVIVEDKDRRGTWLAVDSYYGAMTSDEYYRAPYSFKDFSLLDSINPKWRLV